MNKIVFIDWMVFVHKAIFAWRKNKQIPHTWNIMNMIIANLKRIGVESNDRIIVLSDSRKSWRKEKDQTYKSGRKKFRDSFEDIDWTKMFGEANGLLEKIDECLNWNVLQELNCEADDFASVACRYEGFKNNKLVFITIDSDWQILWQYLHVSIFSPMTKNWKIKPKNFNAYSLIAKKIEKEQSDGLVSPILNQLEYQTRYKLVNLLELPDDIESKIKIHFDNLKFKTEDLRRFPFRSIKIKLENLCVDKSKIITYEKSIKIMENRAKKKLKKKQGGKKK